MLTLTAGVDMATDKAGKLDSHYHFFDVQDANTHASNKATATSTMYVAV